MSITEHLSSLINYSHSGNRTVMGCRGRKNKVIPRFSLMWRNVIKQLQSIQE